MTRSVHDAEPSVCTAAWRGPLMLERFHTPLLTLVVVFACGEGARPDPAATHNPSPQPPEQTAPNNPAAESAPVSPAVDLLHAVPATVIVSSAYRDDAGRVAGLVDSDTDSAWNSRTGDLVGAWVEVHLPVEAAVTQIQLTAGFTRQRGDRDLFTSNHRIAEVQVARNGEALGTFPLNTNERGLQVVPVTGQGGVYRVTVTRTVEGSRPDWREVCVSELRVMGHTQTARAGQHTPTIRVAQGTTGESLPTSAPTPLSNACEEADFANPNGGTCVVLPLGRPLPSGGRVDVVEFTEAEFENTQALLVIGAGDNLAVEPLGERSEVPGATEDYRINRIEVTASEVTVRWTQSSQEFPCTGDGADDGSPECHPPADRTSHRARCRLEGAGTETAGWECETE